MTVADSKTHTLVGQNYTTPDLVAKVTGKAKYAEDFRANGMLFAKLLLSPMPYARVRHLDAKTASVYSEGATAMAVIRDVMPAFELFQPANVNDALTLVDRHGSNAWIMAGGVDTFDWLKDSWEGDQVV